jgi:hypothetical protein
MKGILVWVIGFIGLLAIGQENKPQQSQEELEARFKSTFNKATMSGRWASLQDGKLGEEKKDQYTINSVTKVGKDLWLMNAQMQYKGKDVPVPVPVQVKWAGDTAVIIVDNFAVPGGNGNTAYSARVMVYENTYSGTWSGGDHAGMLYGTITQAKDSGQSKQ